MSLEEDFQTLKHWKKTLMVAPFSFDCTDALNDCQMELFDGQCDLSLKEIFLKVGSKDFLGGLSGDKFPPPKNFVEKIMVLFESTYYVCEQIPLYYKLLFKQLT